jgi:adenine phosphoribosyltransferase
VIGAPVAYCPRIRASLWYASQGSSRITPTQPATSSSTATDTLEIHRDAFGHKSRVLIVDDLLATGGTASAAIQLVRRLDGEVAGCAFIIELAFLNGRKKLETPEIVSLIKYE